MNLFAKMSKSQGYVLAGLDAISHCVVVSGPISAGKSTLMAGVQRWVTANRRDATVRDHMAEGDSETVFFLLVHEPVNEWTVPKYTLDDGQPISILGASYVDAKRYGFTFQVNACTSRLVNISHRLVQIVDVGRPRKVVIIAERWLDDDHLFFSAVCDSNQGMEMARDVYEHQLFPLIGQAVAARADMMIYLPVSQKTCEARIVQRARAEETTVAQIDADYMALIARKHDELAEKVASDPAKLLVRLDVFEQTLDSEAIDREVNSLMTTIMAF